MKKRFLILIEDDFEIMGNGLGNVAELQYLPALALMNIAQKYNVKLTFMVDVAHQLILSENHRIRKLRVQKQLWDETILLMKENGFDVQLHLHPQWRYASYKDGCFYLDSSWNIGSYSRSAQKELISQSVSYLKNLIEPSFPGYDICAYKAGSWGMQPSSNLLTELKRAGIKIVMGVRSGLKIPKLSIDYTNLEEKYLPYYPSSQDITKVSDKEEDVVVIPLQPYSPGVMTLTRLIFHSLASKLRYKNNLPYYQNITIPDEILKRSPLKDKSIFNFSLKPYHTHLKIGNQPFSFLKSAFDATISNLMNYDIKRIPIVIESHTKQYPNHYDHIERYIAYHCCPVNN